MPEATKEEVNEFAEALEKFIVAVFDEQAVKRGLYGSGDNLTLIKEKAKKAFIAHLGA